MSDNYQVISLKHVSATPQTQYLPACRMVVGQQTEDQQHYPPPPRRHVRPHFLACVEVSSPFREVGQELLLIPRTAQNLEGENARAHSKEGKTTNNVGEEGESEGCLWKEAVVVIYLREEPEVPPMQAKSGNKGGDNTTTNNSASRSPQEEEEAHQEEEKKEG